MLHLTPEFSSPEHGLVGVLYRIGVWRDAMLVHHVPPPVILPRERLATLSGPRAIRLSTVVLARLVVLVVDVAIQMGLGAKPHGAAGVDALVWPIMVPLVMTGKHVSTNASSD